MIRFRKYPYFGPEKMADGRMAPAPLCWTVERAVRFEEVDSLNMVWHGRYPSYFEDARMALGEAYGCGYAGFFNAGVSALIKQMGLDYIRPLRFGQRCAITAMLHWSAAARINFSYQIKGMDGTPLATGYTVQLFLDADSQVFIFKPAFFIDFCTRWESGILPPAV